MGRETLEPQELFGEEDAGRGRRRPITTRVAITAAVLAVLASISALEAEHTAAESILHKNDAVLAQSRASDEWAFRQAKSIKLHLEALRAGDATDVEQQRAEITASEERARALEQERDAANREATEFFEQHHRFAVGTSLLQIAIVLETVAAVIDRRSVWYLGVAVGAVGALALANGFLRLV
jgi:hypothetical protein